MKKSIFLLVFACCVLSATKSHSQDFLKTDPDFNKVLVDTTVLVASEVTFLPGKKTGMHSHPAFFAYVLEGGKLSVEYEDGQMETIELKPGDNVYSGPEKPHTAVNIGNSVIKMLVVELKEYPYIREKKMMKKG